MITLFLLLISASAHAKGEKILYSWGSGQGVAVVGDDSKGADATVKGYEVIWDERKDGPMPRGVDPLTASRLNGRLINDAGKIAAKTEVDAAENAKKTQRDAENSEFESLKEKLNSESVTLEEMRKLLKITIKKLGQ